MPPRSSIPAKRPAAEAQEAAWVADEDRFVLQQSKKKAAIRAKSGRAQPIDWLAVTQTLIDPDRDPRDDEIEEEELEIVDPEAVFEGLSEEELRDLGKAIGTYETLERGRKGLEYWGMMRTICQDRLKHTQSAQWSARGVTSVAGNLDKLLGPKNLGELEQLEGQIKSKLATNEPIDTDYWEHLLKSLLVYKARAKLRTVSQQIVEARRGGLRKQQAAEAETLKGRLEARLVAAGSAHSDVQQNGKMTAHADERHPLDPEPLLRLRPEDKTLPSLTSDEYTRTLLENRRKFLKTGILPSHKCANPETSLEPASKRARTTQNPSTSASSAIFDREVARGLGENEELLTTEVPVETKNKHLWPQGTKSRKPLSFNRVLMGYEWNKYNQTHYDHENPPPKVVQGYKFNIFYPDLLDPTKAPTYKIEREGGRRRGEIVAKAGEEDMCVLRFSAGAPYEDVAWRVVDREWDFSSKGGRGFRSSFEKGVLGVWFGFKKIYYRK